MAGGLGENSPVADPSAPRISVDSLIPPAVVAPSHAEDADDDTDSGQAARGSLPV